MLLEINYRTTIREVKEQFASYFPYLKIEFLNGHLETASPELFTEDSTLTVCGLPDTLQEAAITIHPFMTVGEFENTLKQRYGLAVLIYRRLGKTWMAAPISGGLTLEQQNKFGKTLTNCIRETFISLLASMNTTECKN